MIYSVPTTATVIIKVASSVLSPEAKQALDQVAQRFGPERLHHRDRGFASADGSEQKK